MSRAGSTVRIMARYPEAVLKPIVNNIGPVITNYEAVILHVGATQAPSLYGWFNNPEAKASSHFYVRYDGTVEQYVDTSKVAWTTRTKSRTSIGIETQGLGDGAWTQQQIISLVQLIVWAHKTHGVPLKMLEDSIAGKTGIGWHRQGIDPWRTPGGEVWGDRGKVCPGDKRVPQIAGIIKQAYEVVHPPVVYPAPFTRTLRRDMVGKDVLSLQYMLRTPGVVSYYWRTYLGRPDGAFGPKTEATIKAFQKARGLTVDGVAGPKTLQALTLVHRSKVGA